MIEKIAKLLALRVTSDSRVATIGSIIIYIGGIALHQISEVMMIR